ncbi:hypothetical protein C8Q78DRAFT_1147457 [Trametes maxima]|nr:hypothetical protein C8Q78DRAFT_1147457 [Trametes maxima]
MHNALFLNELVANICSYVDKQADLAALARTCSDFHEPAIQFLWANLSTLVPLLMTLPHDAWEVDRYCSRIKILRRLLPKDWNRFLKYSRHVQTLGQIRAGPRSVYIDIGTSKCFEQLCAMRPVKTLLPKLRIFTWSQMEHADAELPTSLSMLGTRLTEVDIEFPQTEHSDSDDFGDSLNEDGAQGRGQSELEMVIPRSLLMLTKHAPNLRHFLLITPQNCDDSADIIAALSSTIGAFRRLKFFICNTIPLNEAGIEALASLPDLASCKILLQENPVWPADKSLTNTFRRLKWLTITGSTIAVVSVANVMVFPKVKNLDLHIVDHPDAQTAAGFLPALRRGFSPSELRYLCVSCSCSDSPSEALTQPESIVLDPSGLYALLDFTELRSFWFSPVWAYNLEDVDVLAVARAWPRLMDFALRTKHAPYFKPYLRTSLRSLAHLAAHCPELRSIYLNVDATVGFIQHRSPVAEYILQDPELYGDLPADPGPPINVKTYSPPRAGGRTVRSASRVIQLDVGYSKIEPVLFEAVTEFLAAVFPEVSSVGETPHRLELTHNEQEIEYRRCWETVSLCVGLMHHGRMDERRRWRYPAAPVLEMEGDRQSDEDSGDE